VKVVPLRRVRERGRDPLRSKIVELEEEVARLRREREAPPEREGLLVALARILEEGRKEATLEALGKVLAATYFSWHSEEVDEFGYDPKFSEALEPFFEFLYTLWWRVETTGIENVPGEGPALMVANHSGVLPWDGLMIKVALKQEHPSRRPCRMLALDMFALLPILAPLLSRTGAVRASQENGARLLEKGELVGVFPEGVKGVGKLYRNRYRLARFGRGGFVRLALRTRAPIVPCAVVGAEEIYPVLARADFVGRPFGLPYFPLTPTFPWLGLLGVVPLPTKWTLDFADPIPTAAYGPEAAEDPILVNRLSQQVRSTLQRMVDGRLARRRSVFLG
jgi:1-acyl-sn-glycerol-3-phosphate acyltransferase